MAANSNESGQSILHNSMPKEKFIDVLRQKTYPYTWSNTYDAALFLSIVNENQISIYYRGKGSPASWYEADVEEDPPFDAGGDCSFRIDRVSNHDHVVSYIQRR